MRRTPPLPLPPRSHDARGRFANRPNPPPPLPPHPVLSSQDAEKGAAPFVEEPLDSTYDHPSTRPTETPSERGVRRRTTAVTNAAFIVERIDENVLPGSFVAISSSKSGLNGIGITKLADITLYRGLTQVREGRGGGGGKGKKKKKGAPQPLFPPLPPTPHPNPPSFQALLSPLAGLFGDRVNRVYVIGFASFLWGIMTIAMGLAQNYTQMLAFSCVNGLGLALLIPCVQSLLADYYAPASRGRAFGLLYFTSSLGKGGDGGGGEGGGAIKRGRVSCMGLRRSWGGAASREGVRWFSKNRTTTTPTPLPSPSPPFSQAKCSAPSSPPPSAAASSRARRGGASCSTSSARCRW